ncbi:MAG: hypothetical protein ABSD80_03930, partial [Caulobacteraceae bacterium]
VQEAHADLKASGAGAVLVTNGAFGELGPMFDSFAVNMKSMGVALANAAKHKLVGLLAARLKDDGIFFGQVMVAGMVKGTAWDTGGGGIDPATVAGRFWDLYQGRGESYARVS